MHETVERASLLTLPHCCSGKLKTGDIVLQVRRVRAGKWVEYDVSSLNCKGVRRSSRAQNKASVQVNHSIACDVSSKEERAQVCVVCVCPQRTKVTLRTT